ncbi:hypothetical protein FB45DRAFT_861081 [Roridomyces roridus]|uniref:Uncharacterized protein n=1 Tax=Roridomyces roridus TaxID=1738132 RepID=A0AAD7CGS1_9AGAR|nr:hypothetical protein FB45DRAFT_861081 [Roridomyces roridus]
MGLSSAELALWAAFKLPRLPACCRFAGVPEGAVSHNAIRAILGWAAKLAKGEIKYRASAKLNPSGASGELWQHLIRLVDMAPELPKMILTILTEIRLYQAARSFCALRDIE